MKCYFLLFIVIKLFLFNAAFSYLKFSHKLIVGQPAPTFGPTYPNDGVGWPTQHDLIKTVINVYKPYYELLIMLFLDSLGSCQPFSTKKLIKR